jgi:membrane associated rhomboid family serine protease
LGTGAIGGLLGAAGGTALCVVREGTANPGGGWVAAWLFRLLPFGVLGIVEGAVVGLVVGVAMAWIVSRSRRRSAGV